MVDGLGLGMGHSIEWCECGVWSFKCCGQWLVGWVWMWVIQIEWCECGVCSKSGVVVVVRGGDGGVGGGRGVVDGEIGSFGGAGGGCSSELLVVGVGCGSCMRAGIV